MDITDIMDHLLRFRYGSEKMVLSKVMGVPQARWMVCFMGNPSIKGIIFGGCPYFTSKWCYSGAIMVDIIDLECIISPLCMIINYHKLRDIRRSH